MELTWPFIPRTLSKLLEGTLVTIQNLLILIKKESKFLHIILMSIVDNSDRNVRILSSSRQRTNQLR